MTALDALAWPVVALTGLCGAWALARDWLRHLRAAQATHAGVELEARLGARFDGLERSLAKEREALVELREYVVRLDNRTQLAPGAVRR